MLSPRMEHIRRTVSPTNYIEELEASITVPMNAENICNLVSISACIYHNTPIEVFLPYLEGRVPAEMVNSTIEFINLRRSSISE